MSSLLAIVMLMISVMTPQLAFAITNEEQAEVDKLNDKINSLERDIIASDNKIKAIEEKKITTKQTVADLHTQVTELDNQINIYNQKISLLNKTIASLNTQIKQTQEEIVIQEQDIEETKELLRQRLRTMYMAGETSSVEILLSADSFESFLTRMQLVQSVSKHDSDLIKEFQIKIDKLKESEKSLREKQVQVQSDKEQVDVAKAALVPKKRQLDAKVIQMNLQLYKLSTEDAQARRVQQDLERRKEAFAREVDDILNGRIQHGSGSVGKMIWPVPYKGTYISSRYGWRTLYGQPNFHRGLDITMPGAGGTTGPFTKQLVAVADGTVALVAYDPPGYGWYVAIDHGEGVQTRYGHCYSTKVRQGQKVTQGQVIAIMGTTGNSTGAHVHFEVLINGVKQNPELYLSKPPDVK
jgi:murein DD-endopeptidase MepM/ murein hydrolase activator NlpD